MSSSLSKPVTYHGKPLFSKQSCLIDPADISLQSGLILWFYIWKITYSLNENCKLGWWVSIWKKMDAVAVWCLKKEKKIKVVQLQSYSATEKIYSLAGAL